MLLHHFRACTGSIREEGIVAARHAVPLSDLPRERWAGYYRSEDKALISMMGLWHGPSRTGSSTSLLKVAYQQFICRIRFNMSFLTVELDTRESVVHTALYCKPGENVHAIGQDFAPPQFRDGRLP
jgi:hypothetical protein